MNDAIRAAVGWWRDALRNAKQDVTDMSGQFYRTASQAIQPMLSDDQLDAFAAELELGLSTVLSMPEPIPPEAALHVEFSPEGLLYAAARKGKIGAMYFPTQTHMHVRPSQVDVTRPGAGGRHVIWRAVESKTA